MSDQADILSRALASFGILPEESGIYLHLLTNGTESALDISRQIHMARTRVYRILDKLVAKGLVAQKFDRLGLKFSASAPGQLEFLLIEREKEIAAVRTSFPVMVSELEKLASIGDRKSKVTYHPGIEGLKYVTWKSLEAQRELCIFEIADMSAFIENEMSEEIRRELVKRRIHTRQLTNIAHYKPWTDVTENAINFWTPRYIDPKELKITSEILIFNDTVVVYHYLRKDIFCVEIENPDLAAMQKQLFEFIWRYARPMKIIGIHGEAKIKREDRR
jgi:sugar-specific transcriptional regulator TrmB